MRNLITTPKENKIALSNDDLITVAYVVDRILPDRKSTLTTYKSCLNTYAKYCQENGLQELPFTSRKIIDFLWWVSERYSYSYVNTNLAALNKFREAVLEFEHEMTPAIVEAMRLTDDDRRSIYKAHRKIGGSMPRMAKQATPITDEQLDRLYAVIPLPKKRVFADGHTRTYEKTEYEVLRDTALVSGLYYGMMRRSEVSSLTWDKIDFVAKTFALEQTKNHTEALIKPLHPKFEEALEALRASTPAKKTVVALAPGGISKRINSLALDANLDITTHSFRVAAAIKMASKGMSDIDIMKAGGWKSEKNMLRYIERYTPQLDSIMCL